MTTTQRPAAQARKAPPKRGAAHASPPKLAKPAGAKPPTPANGKKKTGRPLLEIDPKIVEGMAGVGATDREIGDFVGCDGDTISRRFADVLTKARSGMRTRLRQAQFKAALGGNVTMLIWLGKQMLEQSDETKVLNEHTGALQVRVVHEVIDPNAPR